jgi:hypothetical protein
MIFLTNRDGRKKKLTRKGFLCRLAEAKGQEALDSRRKIVLNIL